MAARRGPHAGGMSPLRPVGTTGVRRAFTLWSVGPDGPFGPSSGRRMHNRTDEENPGVARAMARLSARRLMSCGDATDALWEYLDGELDPARAADVRDHVTACLGCRARHDARRSLLGSVARAGDMDFANDALRARISAMLHDRGLLS